MIHTCRPKQRVRVGALEASSAGRRHRAAATRPRRRAPSENTPLRETLRAERRQAPTNRPVDGTGSGTAFQRSRLPAAPCRTAAAVQSRIRRRLHGGDPALPLAGRPRTKARGGHEMHAGEGIPHSKLTKPQARGSRLSCAHPHLWPAPRRRRRAKAAERLCSWAHLCEGVVGEDCGGEEQAGGEVFEEEKRGEAGAVAGEVGIEHPASVSAACGAT